MTSLHKPKCLLVALAGLLFWSFAAQAERYTVPLLVPAGTTSEPQGVLRILNASDESGAVEIYAINDAGTRSGPASFTLSASAAAEFTATDLASGNATLGLTGGIGTEVGDARLQIETDLDIVPLAFVRAVDGTLSAMHDTVRGAASDGSVGYTYNVPVFNPTTEMTQVSRLRLINPGDAAAAVTIGGRDDSGAEAIMGDVTLALAAGGAKTLTAQQLEAGDTDLTGQLGAGTGKWRLTVSSDQPLEVVNIVASTAGYWNNLSTTAVTGAAPGSQAGFNERFVGNSTIYETSGARSTLEAADGNRFTDTVEADGVTETYMGSYGYRAIGPDAGLLTLDYDDGDACRANLYFSSRTSGWFASHCTGSDYPAEGSWLGGTWLVEADDGAGDVTETTYEVNDALPGVPTSGVFAPSIIGGGTLQFSGSGTTIGLNNDAYFELNDGTRYTCASAIGCTIVNGTVTAGTVTGRAPGAGEVDRFPSFRTAAAPGNQTYTVGTAIDTLTLPEATGGNGDRTYSLSPSVPGLTFNATTRQLTGTPSIAGTHAMTYTVTDEDGDTDTLSFTITVSAGTPTEGSLGECYVSLTVGIGQNCTYPGTTDAFSVNARGRGSFLGRLAGIRIRINNETINGRVYDFEASHQGDGVWRIDRIAGSTEVPETPPMPGGGTMEPEDTSPSFAAGAGPGNQTYTVGTAIDTLTLPEASGGDGTLTYSLSPNVPGLSFNASARQLTGTPSTAASYDITYTATDEDGDTDTLGFTITVENAGGGVPGDHGNSRATATEVEAESDTDGVLGPGDVDYFRIVVDAAGALEAYTSGGIDTRGWLEDADGAELGTNDDGGAGTNFRISEDVSPGTYFVRVEGNSSQVRGDYTLHVRFTESDSGTTPPGAAAIQRLTDHDATDASPSWSPDGQRIAFHSYRDGNWEVYVMDADGANPRNLTEHDATDAFPSWSPDGQRIAFHSYRDGNWEVYVMDADGANPRNLTDHDATDQRPSWSPDGQRIAFDSYRDGNNEVYVMNADGTNPQRLTDHDSGDQNPSWSPNGQRIAFQSNRDGNWEVYVMDADGANPRNLTDRDAFDAYPSWSPDGQRIAFHSDRDGNWEVYVVDADGANPRRLTDHDANDERPSWSPDGQRIGFRSDRDGDWEVYVMDADGDGTGQDPLPRFAADSDPGDLTFTTGTAISALTLPAAGGGDGPRTYSLSPEVPGLIFNATANERELSGTPSRVGTYDMTYRVRDTDGDTDLLTFTIAVTEPAPIPSSPPNVEVSREASNVRVTWDPSPGATHYEVWRCDTRAGPVVCDGGFLFDRSRWTNLARNLTSTTYVDRNPPTRTSIFDPPVSVYYHVQACNSSGCSGPF